MTSVNATDVSQGGRKMKMYHTDTTYQQITVQTLCTCQMQQKPQERNYAS